MFHSKKLRNPNATAALKLWIHVLQCFAPISNTTHLLSLPCIHNVSILFVPSCCGVSVSTSCSMGQPGRCTSKLVGFAHPDRLTLTLCVPHQAVHPRSQRMHRLAWPLPLIMASLCLRLQKSSANDETRIVALCTPRCQTSGCWQLRLSFVMSLAAASSRFQDVQKYSSEQIFTILSSLVKTCWAEKPEGVEDWSEDRRDQSRVYKLCLILFDIVWLFFIYTTLMTVFYHADLTFAALRTALFMSEAHTFLKRSPIYCAWPFGCLFNPCEEDPEKSHQNWTTPALHEGRFEMFYFKENVARLSLDDRKECQFIFAAMPCGYIEMLVRESKGGIFTLPTFTHQDYRYNCGQLN